jgi:formate hydrogenlyase transcriptional activator
VIERAVILSEDETLNVDGTWFQPHDKLSSRPIPPSAGYLLQSEREIIETALAETHGHVDGPSGAAVTLGLARQTLESKIRALKIDKFRFNLMAIRAKHERDT